MAINRYKYFYRSFYFLHQDSLRHEHKNQYQDDISEHPTSIRNDYNDGNRGFQPSQPLVGVVTPTSNYNSDYSTNYLPKSTEQEGLNKYSYDKQNNNLPPVHTDIDFNMDQFMGKNIHSFFVI